jgi:omega-6 fatty acid desaturase (delta-12 desaturase)
MGPMSPQEFRALPRWRQALERIYRGGGFELYYLIERWWKHKPFPRASLDAPVARTAWSDFALIVTGFTA